MKYISDLHFDKSTLNQECMHDLVLKHALAVPEIEYDNSLLIVGDLFPVDSIQNFKKFLSLLSGSFSEVFWIIGNADLRNKAPSQKIIQQANVQIKDLGIENVFIVDFACFNRSNFVLIGAINEKILSREEYGINLVKQQILVATHYPLSNDYIKHLNKKFNCRFFISGHLHFNLNESNHGIYYLRNSLTKNKKTS